MSDYLIHYGVKGMKWGVRKERPYSGSKRSYKIAKKEYNKSFNRAYNYSSTHPIRQNIKGSKWQKESDKRWGEAIDKAVASNKAREKYRNEKKAYKKEHPMSTEKKVAIAAGVGVAVAGTILAVYGKKQFGSLNPKKMKAAKEIANRISGKSNQRALKSIKKTYSMNKSGNIYKNWPGHNPMSKRAKPEWARRDLYEKAYDDTYLRNLNTRVNFDNYLKGQGGQSFVRRNYRG